ncbi:trigger factor [Reichenbachiella carrageenanivorans]|uniref:Trigger factor n=1 Tax=Reichenbachiella carrageenanivorans TaxID=2979869 RepID=A0ABY6D5S7_9BACT|nr:trigger factor [Reichenbachiella carrageenanivorans]UXX81264.1 trigger factor [Reichenbachiella carrageenanivorans]
MDIQLDQISKVEALIKINLKEADYQPKVEEKLKEYSKKAQVKGFRPGKVPQSLVKKMYGNSILVDEINHMVSHKVMDYIKENDIQILGDPLPNAEKAAQLDWANGKEFEFEYEIGIVPEFDLKVDKKIKVDTYTIKVDDKLLDETLDNLKKQFGETTNPKVSEAGDALFGNILTEGEEENAGALLDINDVEKKAQKDFIGKKSGDVIEFDPAKAIKDEDIRKTFLGEANQELKGKIKFEVKNVNRTVPAELNQELFDKTFGKDAVKTEEEFKEKVKATIADNYNRETEGYTELKIRDAFIDKTKMELPDTFLKKWLELSNKNQLTKEQIDKDYPLYANDLKWSLIKNKISKDSEIKTEHEDVVNEAKNMIRAQFGSMGMSEAMEENIDAFADNYLKGEEGQNYMKLNEKVFNDKVMAYIKETISIKAKEVTAEEYKAKA